MIPTLPGLGVISQLDSSSFPSGSAGGGAPELISAGSPPPHPGIIVHLRNHPATSCPIGVYVPRNHSHLSGGSGPRGRSSPGRVGPELQTRPTHPATAL